MRQKGFASIIVLLVVIMTVVGGIVYIAIQNKIPKENKQQEPISPTISLDSNRELPNDALPTGVATTFQKSLAENCKTLEDGSGSSYKYIEPSKLPVKLSQVIIDSIEDPFTTQHQLVCLLVGREDSYLGYASLATKDKTGVALYDDNTYELGHDGPYSFFGSLDTIVKESKNVQLSIALNISGTGPSVIGETSLELRGEKQLPLKNGEVVKASVDKVAIPDNDPRLVKILNKYSKELDSQYYGEGKREIDWSLEVEKKIKDEIKTTFF